MLTFPPRRRIAVRSQWMALGFCALAVTARAEVGVNRLFSDGAVLQRGRPVPVWGTAAPGESVTVAFAGQTKQADADARGSWRVQLDPLPASREARQLVVRGSNTVTVKDVVVGEVWLLAGQSNMAFLMSSMARPSEREPEWPELARRDMAAADDPLLREFRVDNRPSDRLREDVPTKTGWMSWTPASAGGWAAMAAYFGKRLRGELEVPVGLVVCAWGGSACAAWVSPETLRSPELNAFWPEDIIGTTLNRANSHLYHGMLRPLAPYAIAGAAWYQGETEAISSMNPFTHRFMLAAMIRDWRRLWASPELPFYIVQLPNRDREPRWPVVRESQAWAAAQSPATRLVNTIDLGQAFDLHPRNKPQIAGRLADMVLGLEYGRPTWAGAATFEGASMEPGAMRVTFRGADAGLATSDDKPPAEFEVAGADQVFHPAQAVVEGRTVRVSSAAVAAPLAVRHAWKPAPVVNLTHRSRVPLTPFRSDDWPVEGEEFVARPLPVKAVLDVVTTGAALVKGPANSLWSPSSSLGQLGPHRALFVEARGQSAAFTVRGFPVRPDLPASPPAFWTATPPLDAARGFTIEVRGEITRAGNPQRGLDLEAGVPRADGTWRRYLLTAFPMRVHTFQNNLSPRTPHATETVVLRTGLDPDPAAYRIAVRPDGVAQFYVNGMLLGTSAGETLTTHAPEQPYVRVGKTLDQGEWAATLSQVSFDPAGAFGPAAFTSPSEVP